MEIDKKTPSLLVVILNYINSDVTLDCLSSLSVCPTILNGVAKVIVWENGSGSDAVNKLTHTINEYGWGAWVNILFSQINLGFTGGNNRVIEGELNKGELPEYVLLLNSDTLVTNDSLTVLINFMDHHPNAGIAGSQLLTESGEHQCSPFRFPGVASEFEQGLKLGLISRCFASWNVSMIPPVNDTKVDWVSGASMILRREMLQQIGLLDEAYFTYFEDVDLCQRAHRASWEVWYVPGSQVIHLEGASSGIASHTIKRRPKFWFEARRRYFLKHEGKLRAIFIDTMFILGFSIWRARRLLQGKPDLDPPYMLMDFIMNSVITRGFAIPEANINMNSQSREK